MTFLLEAGGYSAGVKTLYLLRHGKSDWDNSLPDHDRPLAPRGVRAAASIAAHLRKMGAGPELVACSSAVRATETLDPIREAVGNSAEIRVEDALYGAAASDLMDWLRKLPDELSSVMIVGHNPTVEDLATQLAGRGPKLERMREKFPTAALATLAIPRSWGDLEPGVAELTDFVVPRDLG